MSGSNNSTELFGVERNCAKSRSMAIEYIGVEYFHIIGAAQQFITDMINIGFKCGLEKTKDENGEALYRVAVLQVDM